MKATDLVDVIEVSDNECREDILGRDAVNASIDLKDEPMSRRTSMVRSLDLMTDTIITDNYFRLEQRLETMMTMYSPCHQFFDRSS